MDQREFAGALGVTASALAAWETERGTGDRDRVVPITTALAREIRRAGVGWWLFPNDNGGHLSAEWVGTLCAAALPGGWTLHGCRHRFATRAYRGSRDLRAVQELLGHSSPVVTQRYVAVDAGALRTAMMAANTSSPVPIVSARPTPPPGHTSGPTP